MEPGLLYVYAGDFIPLPVPADRNSWTQANTDWANWPFSQIQDAINPTAVKQCKTCPECLTVQERVRSATLGRIPITITFQSGDHISTCFVNQNPRRAKCFWNKNTPDVCQPPPISIGLM